MSHKQQKNKQPHLAVANMPFTPMTHKIEKPTATPYRPLQVNDLATPKINKSHSSVDKVEMLTLQSDHQSRPEPQLQQERQQEKQISRQERHQQISKNQKGIKKASNIEESSTEKDGDKNENVDDSANDLRDLKNALYTCLHVVERMENREKEEELKRKTYKNIQVQTSSLPPKMNTRPQRKPTPNQLAENINNSNEIPSDNFKPQKHYNNLIKASSGNKQNDEKVQPAAALNDNGDNDLQEKMKAMTILLQKLQSRIDEIDNSSQKA